MTGPIVAQYPGICGSCGGHFNAGATILPLDHGWAHFRCPDDAELQPARPGEVECTTCFLIHPEGACDA